MHNTTENFGFQVIFKVELIKAQVLYKGNLVFKKKRTLIVFKSHWHLGMLKQPQQVTCNAAVDTAVYFCR